MIAKKLLITALTAAMLCAGGASLASAESADSKTAPPASEFAPIQRYAIAYDEPRDLAEFYLRDFGLKMYGAKVEQLDHPTNPDMRVMLVTIDPIKAGSLTAVQWRFDLSASEGMWRTDTAGIRRKCASGPDAGTWTRQVCP